MPSERRVRIDEMIGPLRPSRPPAGGIEARLPSWRGLLVLDHGCGDAHRRAGLEGRGAIYVGLDPHSSSSDLLCAGSRIPFADACIDAVVSNAVLHLVPDPRADMREIARVLRPGGSLVGYVGFLEGNSELTQFPMTHVGLRLLIAESGLELVDLSVGAYGIDYQIGNLIVPPGLWHEGRDALRSLIRTMLRGWFWLLASAAAWRGARRGDGTRAELHAKWRAWFDLSHAAGYQFTARKPGAAGPPAREPGDWESLLRCPKTGTELERLSEVDVQRLVPEAGRARGATGWWRAKGQRWAYPIVKSQHVLAEDAAVELKAP